MGIIFTVWLVGTVVLSVISGIYTYFSNTKYGLKKGGIDSENVVCIAFWFIVVVIILVSGAIESYCNWRANIKKGT